jgi:hypothetical protein
MVAAFISSKFGAVQTAAQSGRRESARFRLPNCSGPEFDSALSELFALNQMFLNCARHDGSWVTSSLRDRLRQLPSHAIVDIAQSPFSVFDIRFCHVSAWQAAMCDCLREAPLEEHCADQPLKLNLVSSVVFFAWHLLSRTEREAMLLLGLHSATGRALREFPIALLPSLSIRVSGWLSCRWSDNDHFWSLMLGGEMTAGIPNTSAAKLLGRQILAAEQMGAKERGSGPFNNRVKRCRRPGVGDSNLRRGVI